MWHLISSSIFLFYAYIFFVIQDKPAEIKTKKNWLLVQALYKQLTGGVVSPSGY